MAARRRVAQTRQELELHVAEVARLAQLLLDGVAQQARDLDERYVRAELGGVQRGRRVAQDAGIAVLVNPYEDVERPEPGEVLVRVAGSAFNPVDDGIRGGYLQGPFPVTLPHTPGIEVSGTVEVLGEGVSGVAVGDAVIGFLPIAAAGSAAEYLIAPADVLAAAPTSIPLADAAALPMMGLTAWQALFDEAGLTAGRRVLINGAGGAVGGYAVPTIPTPSDEARGVRGVGVFVRSDAEQLARLVALVDRGELRVDVAERVPLAELASVHARAANGDLPGRVIALP